MAHQFYYLEKNTYDYFSSHAFDKGYYSISAEELMELDKNGELDGELENIENTLNDCKKLLKKCYENCKPLLRK